MKGSKADRPAVAVLGVGRMGSGIARTLARGGLALHLYDLRREAASDLATTLGATAWPTAAEAVARADISISMVPDPAAVEQLYRERDGVIAGIRPGCIAIEMSTVSPSTILSLESAIRSRDAGILDAPVSGNPKSAADGTLTAIMAGGYVPDFEQARPVFDRLARRTFHVGPLGAGAAMKLAHQIVVYGLNEALSEALVLAELAGIERDVAYEVLSASAVGAPLLAAKRDLFLRPDSTAVAFTLALAEKDLSLVARLAEELGAQVRQTLTNLEVVRDATTDLGRDADYTAIATYLRRAGTLSG